MTRKTEVRLHAGAGALAMAAIAAFQIAVLWRGHSDYPAEIHALRTALLWGVALWLVPSLAVTGATGRHLAGGWRHPAVAAKQRRMALVALNGILLLLPLAVGLWWLAGRGMTAPPFFWLQGLETVAGLTNLVLLGLNARDGMRIRRRPTVAPA